MPDITQADLKKALNAQPARSWLKNLIIETAHELGTGRYPGRGAGINDTFANFDNVDATHPLRLKYVFPQNFQRLVTARLSFSLLPYRTYSSFTVSATGGQSATHTHGVDHSHSHAHTIPIGAGPFANAVGLAGVAGGQLLSSTTGNTGAINSDATTSSAPTSGGASVDHTHTVSGSSFLGVTEGATAAGVTIQFDGADQTAALGGPWSADIVELDVTKYLPTALGSWHTILLSSTGLGGILSHLRLSFYADASLQF